MSVFAPFGIHITVFSSVWDFGWTLFGTLRNITESEAQTDICISIYFVLLFWIPAKIKQTAMMTMLSAPTMAWWAAQEQIILRNWSGYTSQITCFEALGYVMARK
jgi:hypothetical protein